MKLGNGMGSVYKASGKRRRPWAARITCGWETDPETKKAKQIRKLLGYYATKKEALQALAIYFDDPYDLENKSMSFSDVYAKWSEDHFQTIVSSAQRTWVSAYNHSHALHRMKMKDIRAAHLEAAIRNEDVGTSTKQRMKSLYNLMFKYAMKHEIVRRNYAELCDPVKDDGKRTIIRVPYSNDELITLWKNLDIPFVGMVLIGIYSGWRPQELAILKISDIDFDNWTMFGGIKTDAGKNRYVPIHPLIRDLVRKNYDAAIALGSDFLFNDVNSQSDIHLTYDKYRRRFEKINKQLNMNHRPHDTRHTFITLSKESGMDEYVLKLIVGHAIQDVTEKVYTHRKLEHLQKEMQKIKGPQM